MRTEVQAGTGLPETRVHSTCDISHPSDMLTKGQNNIKVIHRYRYWNIVHIILMLGNLEGLGRSIIRGKELMKLTPKTERVPLNMLE